MDTMQIRGILFAAAALFSLAMAVWPHPGKLRYIVWEGSAILCTAFAVISFIRSGQPPTSQDILWLISFGMAVLIGYPYLHRVLFQSAADALTCQITLHTEEVYEGDSFTFTALLTNSSLIPFHCIRITVSLPEGILFDDEEKQTYTFFSEIFSMPGGSQKEIRLRMRAGRRGLYTLNDITVLYRDLLGFGTRTVRFSPEISRKNTVTVYPMPLRLEEHFRTRRHSPGSVPVSASSVTDPLLFSGIRPYNGDSLSRINWKQSAVHGELLVNTETASEKLDLTLVLNLQSRSVQRADRELSSRELSEMAVAVAAAVVDLASGDNTPLRIITNGETDFAVEEIYPCTETEQLLVSAQSRSRGEYFALLRFLARMKMHLTSSAAGMFDTLSRDPSVFRGGSVVVVSPYFNAVLRDFYNALQHRGIRCVFYITTLYNDFSDIPEDIPIYFRTHRGDSV